MSRVGKKIIEVPANVTVTVAADNTVTVKGPKGELVRSFHQDMKIEQEGNVISVSRPLIQKNTAQTTVLLVRF